MAMVAAWGCRVVGKVLAHEGDAGDWRRKQGEGEGGERKEIRVLIMSRPASQNTLERRHDESRRCIYARKIPHVYALSLK